MPTRKKAPAAVEVPTISAAAGERSAPAPAVVEASAPEVAAEPWDEAGWDLDGEDSSADQEPPEPTETLEELMAEVGLDDEGGPEVDAGTEHLLDSLAYNATAFPPSGLAMRHDMGWGTLRADPPPEPRSPISLLIAPGPDRCGAVVSLDAPDLDSGEWLRAKFRMLDNWVFTPEGGDPTRVNDDQLELLSLTPIRFLFHGKTGVLAREYLADQADFPAPLCIVPHAFSLAGVGVNSPNGYVEVRAVDGEVPVLEVRPGFPPEAS